jgi:hypothetical protein
MNLMEKRLPLLVAPSKNDFKDRLLGRAFRVVPGTNYNGVSYELREKNRSTSFQLYEVVLDENSTWDYLKDQIYPSLARFLKYKSVDPAVGRGVVISLFFMNQFYLIDYPDFVRVYCEIEGLTEGAFRLHVITWLSNINR